MLTIRLTNELVPSILAVCDILSLFERKISWFWMAGIWGRERPCKGFSDPVYHRIGWFTGQSGISPDRTLWICHAAWRDILAMLSCVLEAIWGVSSIFGWHGICQGYISPVPFDAWFFGVSHIVFLSVLWTIAYIILPTVMFYNTEKRKDGQHLQATTDAAIFWQNEGIKFPDPVCGMCAAENPPGWIWTGHRFRHAPVPIWHP